MSAGGFEHPACSPCRELVLGCVTCVISVLAACASSRNLASAFALMQRSTLFEGLSHSPGGRDNDQALDVEDEEKELPVPDQFEQPRLVNAAHRQRYGEAQVAHQRPLLDGDVFQHEHDHAREEGAVGEAVEEPYCLGHDEKESVCTQANISEIFTTI